MEWLRKLKLCVCKIADFDREYFLLVSTVQQMVSIFLGQSNLRKTEKLYLITTRSVRKVKIVIVFSSIRNCSVWNRGFDTYWTILLSIICEFIKYWYFCAIFTIQVVIDWLNLLSDLKNYGSIKSRTIIFCHCKLFNTISNFQGAKNNKKKFCESANFRVKVNLIL